MTPARAGRVALAGLAALTLPRPGPALSQGLAERVGEVQSALVTLRFPARPGVCGAGDHILIRGPDGSTTLVSGTATPHDWGEMNAWRVGDPPCGTGDVVVRLRREGGRVGDVELAVVGHGESPALAAGAGAPARIDLGPVDGQEAADFLLVEARGATARAGRRLVLAATLADGAVTWPALLGLGRDRSLHRGTRRAALHAVGRQAGAEAVRALGGIVRDRTEADEIREAAVFSLSRLPDERAVPLLIEVVRTVEDPRVRRHALFWLAEFDDPRALALFEEILSSGSG